MVKGRQDWFDGQLDLDPERLFVIHETRASTKKLRRRPEGERLAPHSPMAIEDNNDRRRAPPPDRNGCANGARRPDQPRSLPRLCRPGPGPGTSGGRHRRDGHLGSHKNAPVRSAIEAAGGKPLYLPPGNPDFNPIENAFAKLKTLLRKAAERTGEELWHKIGALLTEFSSTECANHSAAGYEAV
jgi:hypothetical protein